MEEANEKQENIEFSNYLPIIVEKPLGTHNIFVKTFGCSHNISDS